jgi:hypothetical protein
LKKILIIVLNFTAYIFAQYSPYQGSFYYSLDFGPGFISGDINKHEYKELEIINLHLFKNNEWVDIKYSYDVGDLRLNIGYFVKEKLMLGFNGEFKLVNQIISETDFDGTILKQGNFGLIMGYDLLEISKIQIHPNFSVNYSIGQMKRMASLENGTYNSTKIKDHIEKMNKAINVNGFSIDVGIRAMVFPLSGRFFGFVCPRIQYSYLSYKKDSNSYSNNLNVMTYTVQIGCGYITE